MTWQTVIKRNSNRIRIFTVRPSLKDVLSNWSDTANFNRAYTLKEIRAEIKDDLINHLEQNLGKRRHSIIMSLKNMENAPVWKWDNTMSAILVDELAWDKTEARGRGLRTYERVV